ncbi:MAG TPA: DUF2997 domain-containing protein [Pirellulaceae bacterium]|jgi:hypothetical protein|nr:DUF2997 domain-containing protein [Pirellulaceae bacterium]
MKRITLLVRPDGTSVVEAAGWSGAECRAGTEFLEQALGQRLSERLTPEFYADAENGHNTSEMSKFQALSSSICHVLEEVRTSFAGGGSPKSDDKIAASVSEALIASHARGIDWNRASDEVTGGQEAMAYADRLNSGNLRSSASGDLVTGYPNGDFAIDEVEARRLFHRVRPPEIDEFVIGELFAEWHAEHGHCAEGAVVLSASQERSPSEQAGDAD